jgi:hypothetical protein
VMDELLTRETGRDTGSKNPIRRFCKVVPCKEFDKARSCASVPPDNLCLGLTLVSNVLRLSSGSIS